MKKIVLMLLAFSLSLNAYYKVHEGEDLFKVEIKGKEFKTIYLDLKDQILCNGISIVHEVDVAKSSNNVAEILEQRKPLKNGKSIMTCKASLALEMLKENIDNITYCPLTIAVYEKGEVSYISFKKYKTYQDSDIIAHRVNEFLKDIIIESLEY